MNLAWWFQDLINRNDPDSGDDFGEEIHIAVRDAVIGLEDYSHFESVQDGAVRAVASKISQLDEELLRELFGDEVANNPDRNETAAWLRQKLAGFDFDEARLSEVEDVIKNLKAYLYALDGY